VGYSKLGQLCSIPIRLLIEMLIFFIVTYLIKLEKFFRQYRFIHIFLNFFHLP